MLVTVEITGNKKNAVNWTFVSEEYQTQRSILITEIEIKGVKCFDYTKSIENKREYNFKF